MKKAVYLLLVFTYMLNGCHSATTPGNSNNNALATDTAKMQAIQQPADTTIKDGEVIKRYPNGVIKEKSYYEAGRRHGECQSFYPNGKLWSDDYFTAGLIDGATVAYYDNGKRRYDGTCVKGRPVGIWRYYDYTGKLVRTKNFGNKQDKPVM